MLKPRIMNENEREILLPKSSKTSNFNLSLHTTKHIDLNKSNLIMDSGTYAYKMKNRLN